MVGEIYKHAGTNKVEDSYSMGAVSGNTNVGGLVGYNNNSATVTTSYYNSTTSGQSDSGKGTDLTNAEMMGQANFSGWDFASTWSIVEDKARPYLQYQDMVSGTVYSDSDQSGTEVGQDMRLIVSGYEYDSYTSIAGGEYYLFGGRLSSGDNALVYINDNALDGVTVAETGTASITGLDVYGSSVIFRDEAASGITASTVSGAIGAISDADIITSYNGSTLDVNGDLVVWTGDTLAPSSDITVTGDFINNGTFTHGNNTLTFDGSGAKTLASGVSSLYNLTINGTGSLALQDSLDADNDLLITNGTLDANGQAITFGGSFTNADTFTHNNNTITFDGAGAETFTSGGASLYNLTINGAGSLALQDSLEADNDLEITNGTLAANGQAITFGGSFTNADTFTHNNNTITFDGAGAETFTSGGSSLYDLTINGTGSLALQDSTDINRHLTITSGTLGAGSNTINVAGNWDNRTGTFNAGTSTVVIDGTGTSEIKGSNAFNHFTCNASGKTLQFDAGSEQSIGGILNLNATGGLLHLTSSQAGSYWYIKPSINNAGAPRVSASNLRVSDSWNTSGRKIYLACGLFTHTVGWARVEVPCEEDIIETITNETTTPINKYFDLRGLERARWALKMHNMKNFIKFDDRFINLDQMGPMMGEVYMPEKAEIINLTEQEEANKSDILALKKHEPKV